MKSFVITKMNGGIISAAFSDNRMISIDFSSEDEDNILGNIYIGQVSNIAKNIEAAFVTIAPAKTCYYSLRDNPLSLHADGHWSDTVRIGDEIVLQIEKEAMKSKVPMAVSRFSFTGKYLVLNTGETQIGISKKITDTKKAKEIKTLLEPFTRQGFGFIVRTNAENVPADDIRSEAAALSERCQAVMRSVPHRPCYSVLYHPTSPYTRQVMGLPMADNYRIVTDDAAIYNEITELFKMDNSALLGRLTLYEDDYPLRKLYNIDMLIEKTLSPHVWLKSGGFLMIEPTEALVSVDVNTGKFTGKKNRQATFLAINKEAAKEIALQLKLRNLSGIILVDFIDMESSEAKEELLSCLREELKKDTVQSIVVGMTRLNLVEITRKKIRKPFYEQWKSGATYISKSNDPRAY